MNVFILRNIEEIIEKLFLNIEIVKEVLSQILEKQEVNVNINKVIKLN